MAGTSLVTGGQGRIGKLLVRELIKQGESVIVLDKAAPAGRTGTLSNIRFCQADMMDMDQLKKCLAGVDRIYHLAASIDYKASKDELMKRNVLPTVNLVHVANGMGIKHFVLLSSTAVYGESKDGRVLTEESPCDPYSAYGWSKLECENVVEQSGISYTIIRSSQVFGPQFKKGYVEVLKKLKEGEMKIVGDGLNIIPLVHIDDLISALLFIRGRRTALDQVFNVDGGYQETQAGFMNRAATLLRAPIPKKVNPTIAKFAAKLAGKEGLDEFMDKLARNRPISIDKLKEMGWKPKVELQQAMQEVVEAFAREKLL